MDLEREKERLLRRDAEWAAAAQDGDVERILSFWTDDAIVYPPGLPEVRGRAALRAYVEASLAIPGFQISWTSTEVTVSPDGRLAWLIGTNEVTLPGPAGQPMSTSGRAVTLWRREADGEWRCAVDIWNAGPS